MVIAASTTTTNPLPGPVIVTFDPPKIATIVPPTTAAITPDIGGAPEANAKPKPNGRAINDTTNPAKIFCGISLKNVLIRFSFFIYLTIKTSVGNSDKIYSKSCGNIRSKNPVLSGALITNKSALFTLA